VVALVQPLNGLLIQLQQILEPLKRQSVSNSGPAAIVEQTISQIQSLIDRGERVSAELNTSADALSALAQIDLSATATVLSTDFSVSSGGMEGWMAELAQRFSDPNDLSKPNFTEGSLVAGIVLVAGAPSLNRLDTFKDLMAVLFGSSDDNPLLDAINTVDASLPSPGVIVFNNGLVPSRSASSPEEEKPAISFDSAMNPVTKPVDC
jgi:hypothetical protein